MSQLALPERDVIPCLVGKCNGDLEECSRHKLASGHVQWKGVYSVDSLDVIRTCVAMADGGEGEKVDHVAGSFR